jgi:hypothetical protein
VRESGGVRVTSSSCWVADPGGAATRQDLGRGWV